MKKQTSTKQKAKKKNMAFNPFVSGSKIAYMLIDKDGQPPLLTAKIEVFWLKSVALNHAKAWNYKVAKVKLEW